MKNNKTLINHIIDHKLVSILKIIDHKLVSILKICIFFFFANKQANRKKNLERAFYNTEKYLLKNGAENVREKMKMFSYDFIDDFE